MGMQDICVTVIVTCSFIRRRLRIAQTDELGKPEP